MKKRLNIGNLLFNLLVAFIVTAFTGIAPVVTFAVAILGGTALSFMPQGGMLFAGLLKEIWTDILLEGFYPKGSFVSEGRDMSALVEYNKIHLAEAGANPEVLIDNTSYPIATSQRTDVAKELALKTLDTTSTIVRNLEAMELAYDKMASVVYGHKQQLLKAVTQLSAWNWTPASNATYTPVIATTGAANTLSMKKIKFEDILNLMVKYNAVDLPDEGRVLVLNPQHQAELMEQDMNLFKNVMATGNLFGFKVFTTSATPVFNKSTGAKVAFGAAAAPATDTYCSFAFQKDEVMKAMGTVEMFSQFKSPAEKGDIVNFQMRFCALPLRAKGIAAIYSSATA